MVSLRYDYGCGFLNCSASRMPCCKSGRCSDPVIVGRRHGKPATDGGDGAKGSNSTAALPPAEPSAVAACCTGRRVARGKSGGLPYMLFLSAMGTLASGPEGMRFGHRWYGGVGVQGSSNSMAIPTTLWARRCCHLRRQNRGASGVSAGGSPGEAGSAVYRSLLHGL